MGTLLTEGNLKGLRAGIKALRDMVFPDQCPLCGALVASAGGLCGACWRDTPFITGAICDRCGTPELAPPGDPGAHPRLECDACRSLGRPWQQGRAVMGYRGGARRLVLGLKSGDRLDLVPMLAGWLGARAAPLLRPDTILVPVPIHRWRLLSRRFNQSALLTRALAARLERPWLPDGLIRTRATKPLKAGDYAARSAQLGGAIAPHPRHAAALAGRSVLLVDDVMTSGATAAACARALQLAQAREVCVLTLARAPQRA